MLAANPFSNFANSLKTDVASIQTTLDSTLDSLSSLKSLPFIGQQLGALDQVKTFIDNAGNKIQSELTTVGNVGVTTGELQNELYAALGPSGANVVTATSSIKVTDLVTDSNGLPTSFEVEIWLHQASAPASGNLTFNLGLPALPFKVTTAGSINAMVGFDYDLAVKYQSTGIPITFDPTKNLKDFNSSLPADQLDLSVGASLSGASLTADVGILQGTLVPTPGQQNSLSANVTAQTVDLGGPHNIALSGNAHINLTATLGFGDGNGGQAFPSISTDLAMNWTDLTDPGPNSLTLGYNNVRLNIGQFLSNLVEPVLADIQQYTEPFQGAINVLNDPIPGIDSIPGLGNFSIMTLAGGVAEVTGFGPLEQVVAEALHIVSLINGFSLGSNVEMPFGDFGLDGSAIYGDTTAALDPTVLSNLADSLSNLNFSDLTGTAQSLINSFSSRIDGIVAGLGLPSAATTCLDTLAQSVTGGANASIDFPLFDHPSSIVNLLFGQDVDLVSVNASFNLPNTNLTFPTGASIFGLGVSFNSNIAADASLKIGYDTLGIRELLGNIENGTATPGAIAGDIADGFYIQGPQGNNLGSHFAVSGNIGIGLGLNVGFASVSVDGGLKTNNGPISLSLNDGFPDSARDGKIRVGEIAKEINNGINVFNFSGDLTAGLYIEATEGFGPVSFSQTLLNITSVTLYDSNSASNANLADTTPPTVSSIGPASGPLAGGTTVTIYGTGLDNATEVDFGGEAATIVSDSPTFIVATSPQETIGAKDVTVITTNGTSRTSAADKFTYIEPPLLGGLGTTTAGPIAGGTHVTITGLFLDNATEVEFGGVPAPIISDTDNTIVAVAPLGSAGNVNVTVTTGGGTAIDPVQFQYVPPPAITAMTPAISPLAGGETVTIDGQNFGDPATGIGDATIVTFGKTPVHVKSDVYQPAETIGSLHFPAFWELTAVVPKSTTSGWTDVTVTTTNGGTSATTDYDGVGTIPPDVFTYVAVPSITSLSLSAGLLTSPAPITIFGGDFGGATIVKFGQSTGTINSITELSASQDLWEMNVTPPSSSVANTVQVTVTTPGGVSNSTPFTYTLLPLVTSVSPSAGPMTGGIVVTITGVNLQHVTELSFGPFDTRGTIFSNSAFISQSANQIKVTLPSRPLFEGPAANLDVLVETSDSFSQASPADHFSYTLAPIVTGVSPNAGPYEGGTTVTITGTNLASATAVDFGGTPATGFSVNPNGTITATSPAGALGFTDVTVTSPGGISAISNNDNFDYQLVAPAINSLSVTSGSVIGGTPMIIHGANFLGATEVDFDTSVGVTKASSFIVDSSSQIEVITPAHVAGEVAVVVKTPGKQSIFSFQDQFTYTNLSSVTGLSISSGGVGGGTSVTISGANLAGATAVDFGSSAATSFVVNSDGTITATSPAESAGQVDVTVTTQYGSTATSSADLFTYYVPGPVISALSQNSGAPAGGTSVVITGLNLVNAMAVDFGVTPAARFVYNANGTITATSPAGTAGTTVDVTVVTAGGGTSAIAPADEFTFGAVPSIALMQANFGPARHAYGISIVGANLGNGGGDPPLSTVEVLFGTFVDQFQTNIGNVTVDEEGVIYVTPPLEGAGTVDVRVITPDGESPITPADRFTFVAGPLISGISRTPPIDPNATKTATA